MNRHAKIYLLAIDAQERRLLMRLPDDALSGVEKVKNVFGKEARVIGYSEKQPRTSSVPEPKRA
jgi:hypothetical protein